jgi:hypothetical protein
MKWFAYKDLEDSNKIKLLACKSDAETAMKMASPDKIVSGEGTEEDPYVYAATAELMSELPKDAEGKYIMPDAFFRDAWEDNAGSVSINLAAARQVKKDALDAECKERCAPHMEMMMEAMAEDDAAAEAACKASCAAIKAERDAGKASVDAESDLSNMKAIDPFS